MKISVDDVYPGTELELGKTKVCFLIGLADSMNNLDPFTMFFSDRESALGYAFRIIEEPLGYFYTDMAHYGHDFSVRYDNANTVEEKLQIWNEWCNSENHDGASCVFTIIEDIVIGKI
jgi:hypothetical protein